MTAVHPVTVKATSICKACHTHTEKVTHPSGPFPLWVREAASERNRSRFKQCVCGVRFRPRLPFVSHPLPGKVSSHIIWNKFVTHFPGKVSLHVIWNDFVTLFAWKGFVARYLGRFCHPLCLERFCHPLCLARFCHPRCLERICHPLCLERFRGPVCLGRYLERFCHPLCRERYCHTLSGKVLLRFIWNDFVARYLEMFRRVLFEKILPPPLPVYGKVLLHII